MVVIPNNGGYNAMRKEHHAFYPEGASAAHDIYPGHRVTDLDYAELPKLFGGFGRRVEKADELPDAIAEALSATQNGRIALLNVMVDP